MLKTVQKSIRFLPLMALVFFLIPQNAEAADFLQKSVTLQKVGNTSVSQMIMTDQAFNSVGLESPVEIEGLQVNFGHGWEAVEMHNDYGSAWESLILTQPTQQVQFKTETLTAQSPTLALELSYYEEGGIGGPEYDALVAENGVTDQGLMVISRAQWGANEALRVWHPPANPTPSTPSVDPCAQIEEQYGDQFKLSAYVEYNEKGEELTWPLAYATEIKKFAVHHTDSEIKDMNGDGVIDAQDYQAIVRAIYSFHTVSRGWGDIGYNYLIDPLGNIYEGRYGGEMVVGAHSLCYNHGVIGVAIIGNYQDQTISDAAFKALTQLLGKKSKEYGLDPITSSEFSGKYLDTIFGHKDVRATSCPGAALYADLPRIRDRAALLMQNFTADPLSPTTFEYNAEFVSQTAIDKSLAPGERTKVTLKFKNTGQKSWGNNTWLYVNGNTSPNARIIPIVEGKNFVGADLKESSVAPGKTGTFEIEIEAGYKGGSYNFQVSPVIDGKYKISRAAEYVNFDVIAANFDYQIVALNLPSGNVYQGQHVTGTMKIKNNGNMIWRRDGLSPMRLGTWNPRDHVSVFTKGNRLGYLVQEEVKPGEVAELVLDLYVPTNQLGWATEYFAPVIENVTWLEDKSLYFRVNIQKAMHRARVHKITPIQDMLAGEKRYVEFKIYNLGEVAWDPSNVSVSFRGKNIKVVTDLVPISEVVAPGEAAVVGTWVEMPTQIGSHALYVWPKINNIPIAGSLGGAIKFIFKPGSTTPKTPDASKTPEPVVDNVNVEVPKFSKQPFRVKISHESETAHLTSTSPFLMVDGNNKVLFSEAANQEVLVTRKDNQFEVSKGVLTKTTPILRLVPTDLSAVMEIKDMERRPTWNLELNDNRFRGVMEMRIIDNKVAYINELLLEDYVKGLAEVSNDSPAEKQKVIAVLARTYARFYMDPANRKFPDMPYDGNDDPAIFQKYLGYGVESRSPNFTKAAQETADVVVTYQGNLVKTPYFNQSDGHTRSAQEVWGWTNTPYLLSVPDPWSEGLTLSGHGVGLSGYGATKQAEEGKGYEEIIKYYYTGVAVEKLSFN